MQVPLVDLRAAYRPIQEDVLREFGVILESMQLFLGPNVQSFEREFAAHCRASRGIGVSNGTDALFAALRAGGVGPGHEVIAPAHTFFATIEAIIHTGATPVLVDVEPDTLTIDVEEVRAHVTSSTRAIVPVHLYGHPADMDPILEIAGRHDLLVIEDAAQAHGARYKGRWCGSIGDAASFSFYFTKNLGAFGEAGMVTTSHKRIAEQVELLRHHGHVSKFEHRLAGYNLRMDELQAAVLRLKLPRLDAGNARRRELASVYAQRFSDLPVTLLTTRPETEPVWHLFPIRVPAGQRDPLREHLNEHGIGTGIHYKIPAHQQPALRDHPHRAGKMTVTEQTCPELLSLPMYPELTDEQLDHVTRHVIGFFERPGAGGRRRASTELQVAPIDPDGDPELDVFFERCSTSFAQQTTAWRHVIEAIGEDEPVVLGCQRNGELVGVLPAYRFEGPLGAVLNSVPQAGPLGGVACLDDIEPEPVYAALLDAFATHASATGCALATVISNPFAPDRQFIERHLRGEYVLENRCQVLDLETGLDRDGRPTAGSANLKRNLRKAESGGLVIDETQSPENVEAWYEIHQHRHREIGAVPLPRALFTGALTHMVPRDKARFFFVRQPSTGEMVAGGFYVYHGRVIDALMPAMRSDAAALAANYLLALHTIRWARARGLRYYNWQGSPPASGVYRFKQQWGSRDVSYAFVTRVTGDATPFLESTVKRISEDYRWHYVLPYDRIGKNAGAAPGAPTREAAWQALEETR